jgi:hypothetical protein
VNIKDVITAAVEASLASEAGDIEIAEDLQKTSAWLVALSTASIYFSFSQIQALSKPVDRVFLYGQVLVIALLTTSFVAAYFFRSAYTTFRALCRNLVVGRKILLSQLHENSDLVEKQLAESKIPLWALVHSGQISEVIPSLSGPPAGNVVEKQVRSRRKLDVWFRVQRRTTILGLIAMVLVGAYGAYVKVAA